MLQYIKKSYIKSVGFSDHRLVVTELSFSSFKYGKGFYKINCSLLENIDYFNMIVNEINKTLEEYQQADPQLQWEIIKTNVKEVSQQFSRFQAREKGTYLNDSFKRLQYLENILLINPDDRELINAISHEKAKLEVAEIEKAKQASVRAGIKYIEEGEKCSKYFLSLEK